MKRFALTVLGFVIVFGLISFFRIYQDSSPTPDEAVNNYIARVTKNAPRKVESITVVSAVPTDIQGNEPIILFRAIEQDSQTHNAGYAITKKNLFGWYVEKLQMVSRSPLPDDIMVNLDGSDGRQVIYGEVFLVNAASVEAIFSDPAKGQIIVSSEIPNGIFVLYGAHHGELIVFKMLDSNGNVLKQFTKDELQNKQAFVGK